MDAEPRAGHNQLKKKRAGAQEIQEPQKNPELYMSRSHFVQNIVVQICARRISCPRVRLFGCFCTAVWVASSGSTEGNQEL